MPPANPVADQYARYPYPEPGDDIPAWLQKFNYDQYEPWAYAPLFWPEGQPKTDLNILVAGCGSMQAAVIAFNNRECCVTGVDFSEASIAHEERLRARHRLDNLTLHTMDLYEVSKLSMQFDLIVSTGVLHHLPDPGRGLKALSTVLEPDHGVMALMLYGALGRSGIYPLQDAFRRMAVPQSPEGVERVRAIIERLAPRHPGRWYYEAAGEMRSDAAVVDTFLHRQDVAYSVPQVLEFVETAGLTFQGWLDNATYNVGIGEQDWEWLGPNVPDRDRWAIIECLTMRITNHSFLACRPERDKRSVVSFSGDQWLGYYPVRHPKLRPSMLTAGTYGREQHEFRLSEAKSDLLSEVNGRKSIAMLLNHKAMSHLALPQRKVLAREFFERMWRHGHMFFSAVPVKAEVDRS
jgi:SAM-dependent methyltransferase